MTDEELRATLAKVEELSAFGVRPDGLGDLLVQGAAMLSGRPTTIRRSAIERRLVELLSPSSRNTR